VALIAFLACGALVGFLPYNFPNARAFSATRQPSRRLPARGDGHPAALLHEAKPATAGRALAVARAGRSPGRPRVVVILRTRAGKPFWIGDTNHLSHRLVRTGLSRTRAVLLIWLLATAIGSIAWWL